MFESMDSMRGLALCALAEGRVRNRLAGLWQNPQEQDEEYARTTQCYKQAIDLFDNQVEGELSRRIEARMWYATVLRDWGTARSQRGEDGSQQMQPALDLLHEAQSLCTSETSGIIRSHIFESMAVVFINQQQYEQALNLLHQARDIIPEEYDVLPGFGVTSTPRTQELRIYWLRLAQVELQFALYHFGTGNPREGSVRLLRGIACLMTFSPHTPLLGTFHTLGKRELMKIGDSEHIKALRHDLRAHAQTLRVEPAAAARMEEIFEEVLEDLSLL
jgi:tetratricopeptide (TPR) repeat protein